MKILAYGATSQIVVDTLRLYAAKGNQFFLVARDGAKLERLCHDLKCRGAEEVFTKALAFLGEDDLRSSIEEASAKLIDFDLVFIGWGYLGPLERPELSCAEINAMIDINFTSILRLGYLLEPMLAKQGSGTIAVISSVAGERGKKATYLYGACKAGLNVYLGGLRNRLYHKGVHVLTIKPGYVDTVMTAGMKKNFLFSSSEKVAGIIVHAITNKKDEVFVPGFWWLIMFVFKLIPERLFKRF